MLVTLPLTLSPNIINGNKIAGKIPFCDCPHRYITELAFVKPVTLQKKTTFAVIPSVTFSTSIAAHKQRICPCLTSIYNGVYFRTLLRGWEVGGWGGGGAWGQVEYLPENKLLTKKNKPRTM